MADTQGNATIYRKLVRDRIPQIIREHGNEPIVRKISGQEFNEAVAVKILEEASELFKELRQENAGRILEESADMLETMLAALEEYGFDLSDLHEKMKGRAADRGGFKERLFLEQVGGTKLCELYLQKYPALIFNPVQKNLLISIIKGELERSAEAWIASAFYSPGETNLLVSEFSRFVEHGGKLKIILSTMGNITRPEYFNHMKEHIPGAGLKVFHPPDIPFDQSPPNFHVKAWLFRHRDGRGAMITGSSNFTEGGLVRNYEWNWYSSGEINLPFEGRKTPFQSAVAEFEQVWKEEAAPVTEEFLIGYRARWQPSSIPGTPEVAEPESPNWGKPYELVEPNSAQMEALENLENLREKNVTKAAVVAATGVGKTYLAAFDFVQSKSKNLLFIAHRETILTQALETFRIVTGDPKFGAVYGRGQNVSQDCAAVFAMIQTLSRRNHLENFLARDFDYIVIDEFHHAEAASYRKTLSHFEPSFLLGLTATPERMDGRDVLEYCDYNIAYEIRVLEAVNRKFLVPFQYYAIYDETDYEEITWRGTRYDEEELDRVLQNDTRTSIIANNLRKYLPASGKTKALAFCSSVSHARYTAEKLSDEHGIFSTALWGETKDEERHNAIRRIQDESDLLNVICVVDIFNEGADIPGLTHVLFLRPTQSFTVFLQQLGRGLRKAEGKDFLVVLDFVGNFRKAHVAPLAVCGYTSLEQFVAGPQISLRKVLEQKLPDGCWLSSDLEVQRLWENEIQKIFRAGLSPAERLKNIYQDIKEDLGKTESLNLMDTLSNAYDVDPYLFLKPEPFGGWLRAKNYCESGNIPDAEKNLFDTPGEYLLKHIESGLNYVKSYKMVVLLSLLKLKGTKWDIEDIASGFLAHYLSHSDHLTDYDALFGSDDPENFKLSSVIAHLKRMPLEKFSNNDSDCFELDRESNIFSLKPEYEKYWNDPFFRSLVKDRAEFVLARYFQRARLQQTVYFDPDIFTEGFEITRGFAEKFCENKPVAQNEIRSVKVLVDDEQYKAQLSRSRDSGNYNLNYAERTLPVVLKKALEPLPETGEKAFKMVSEKDSLRIVIPKKQTDLRGIVADIPYAKKVETGMTAIFRRLLADNPDEIEWEERFDRPGYSGSMDVDILEGQSFRAWTGSRYKDKSRFPARIKAAATALMMEGFKGEFHISVRGRSVTITKLQK